MTPLRRQKGTAMDLTAFLLARIAEDEEAARRGMSEIEADPYAWTDFPSGEFDPARVLAECEAKRRIVRRYLAGDDLPPDYKHLDNHVPYWYEPESEALGIDVLRLLASVYTDHPDCREEWRP